ncbi:MAG TPA: EF-hand domain-containing protein [Oscillatoriaceae cyanobacterium]
MRFRSLAAIAASFVVLQGCNLALPTGLLQSLENGVKGPGAQGGDCQAMFFSFDVNGDKVLSQDEYVNGRLAQLQGSKDENLKAQLQAAFKALDTDGDGQVSLQEFLTQCQGPTETPPGATATALPLPLPGHSAPPMVCDQFFSKYDFDGDGYWSQDEFTKWYASLPLMHAQICAKPLPAQPASTPEPELGVPNVAPKPAVLASATVGTAVGSLIAKNGSGLIPVDGGLKPVDPMPPTYLCGAQLEAANAFQKFDFDRDNRLSQAEACAAIGALMPPPGTESTPVPYPPIDEPSPTPFISSCEDNFRAADKNDDLRLDFSEFAALEGVAPDQIDAQTKQALATKFNYLDSNQDGYLTADEYCGADVEPSPPAFPPTPMPPATPTPPPPPVASKM